MTQTGTDSAVTGRLGRKLLAVLKKELVLQHRLLGAITQTREALVDRDVAHLARLQEHQTELMSAAERLGSERMAVSHDIARAAGIPTAGITLAAIADGCPGEVALLIGAAREMLLEVASQVQDAQRLNRHLLENELDYIGASLEVLARAAAPRGDYAAPLRRLGAPSLILDKAA